MLSTYSVSSDSVEAIVGGIFAITNAASPVALVAAVARVAVHLVDWQK
jgi:hypothetical protein